MKASKTSIYLFVIFVVLSTLVFALQIFLSTFRPLTPIENSLIAFIGILFSTAATWFFSKYYSQTSEYEQALIRIIRILEGSVKIGLSGIEPSLRQGTNGLKVLNDITYGFDFFGIGGSKIIPRMFDEKTSIGKFLATNDRPTVRILLLDPDCSHIKKWIEDDNKAARVRKDILKSLYILAAQQKRGRKVQIRLYDFSPPIRIQIVNNQRAYICEYDPLTDGWDTPQLCFVRDGSKPLIDSFIALYDYFWEKSKEFDYESFLNNKVD